MSVMFRSLSMFDSSVSALFSIWCQKNSARRGVPMKRDPNVTSAIPSTIGWMTRGRSCGSYSRSASWMTTMSPVAAAKPARSAAPLPMFLG